MADGKMRKKSGMLQEAWLSLRENRMAVLGMFVLIALMLTAVFARQIAPYPYDYQDHSMKYLAPCREHLFGTDNLGRDIFSRIVYGARSSLLVGILASLFSAAAGAVIGAAAGFYGRQVDNVIMRFIDVCMAIPSTLLAISICAAFGSGFRNVIIAVGIASTPAYARIVRASILSIKEQEFVEAARCIGGGDLRIIVRHIFPNCLPPVIVQTTMGAARSIQEAAALSFIGLGVMPPNPEWGAMLSASRNYIRDYPWMVVFPGLAIMLTVFALNLFGDGLRDAIDPKLKK